MTTSGTRAKQYIVFILLCIGLSHSYAQSDAVLAKSYFLKAQESYNGGDNEAALKNLDKTIEYLGSTNPKVEALYVKITRNQKKYAQAEKHLSSYFDVADEGHSDYMEMMAYVAEVKEEKAEAEGNIAKIAKLKQDFIERVKSKINNNSREDFARQIAPNEVAVSWRENSTDIKNPTVYFGLRKPSYNSKDYFENSDYLKNEEWHYQTVFTYEAKRASGFPNVKKIWKLKAINVSVKERTKMSSDGYTLTYYVPKINSRYDSFSYTKFSGHTVDVTDKIESEIEKAIYPKDKTIKVSLTNSEKEILKYGNNLEKLKEALRSAGLL